MARVLVAVALVVDYDDDEITHDQLKHGIEMALGGLTLIERARPDRPQERVGAVVDEVQRVEVLHDDSIPNAAATT